MKMKQEQLLANLRSIDMTLFILEFKVEEKIGASVDLELFAIEEVIADNLKNVDCLDGDKLKKAKTDLNFYKAKCDALKEQMEDNLGTN